MGRGCGTVGRTITPNTRGLHFEPGPWEQHYMLKSEGAQKCFESNIETLFSSKRLFGNRMRKWPFYSPTLECLCLRFEDLPNVSLQIPLQNYLNISVLVGISDWKIPINQSFQYLVKKITWRCPSNRLNSVQQV